MTLSTHCSTVSQLPPLCAQRDLATLCTGWTMWTRRGSFATARKQHDTQQRKGIKAENTHETNERTNNKKKHRKTQHTQLSTLHWNMKHGTRHTHTRTRKHKQDMKHSFLHWEAISFHPPLILILFFLPQTVLHFMVFFLWWQSSFQTVPTSPSHRTICPSFFHFTLGFVHLSMWVLCNPFQARSNWNMFALLNLSSYIYIYFNAVQYFWLVFWKQ